MSEDNKVIEPRAPSLTNDEVEEFRAYFNEKMSILQKGGKRPEGTNYRLASGISDKEEEEKEEDGKEEMVGKLRRAKGSPLESVPSSEESQKDRETPVQFLDRDDEEDDDGLETDFFKVKRHNVFGLDLKENKTLQVSLPPVEDRGWGGFYFLTTLMRCCFLPLRKYGKITRRNL